MHDRGTLLSELRIAPDGDVPKNIRSVGGPPDLANSSGRLVSYLFSDASIARDGHRILAWSLDNFRRNPVFLWCHSPDEPPIGRIVSIMDDAGKLAGTVEYVPEGDYPFADTIFRLVSGGYLGAVSVSWDPLRWKFATEAGRERGSIDFLLADLLEVSQVPVPAMPNALVTARSAGIDTGPIYEWAEKVLDSGDTVLIPRTELEQLRREAKMPKSKKRATEDPAAVVDQPLAIEEPAAKPKLIKRGMWEVSFLAQLLNDLGFIADMAEFEAAMEEDGSTVPAQLIDALKALGQVLIAMTIEEVNELVAEEEPVDVPEVVAVERMADARLTAFRLMRTLDPSALAAFSIAMRAHAEGKHISFRAEGSEFTRAGKVLSSANEQSLRDAHGRMSEACDMVRGVLDAAIPVIEETNDDDIAERAADAKALRARRAKALKLKVAQAA